MLTTFAGALVFGVLFNLIARKINLSSIAVMLIGGILVGPAGLDWINPETLGEGLKTIIALAVAIILFEGGLTLDATGYKRVSREIRGVLTKGVLITWLTSSLAIKFCYGFPWDFSLLAGSLIIVTGPTVIGPLLKRIRVKIHVQNILHWESVLIDPAGVFIALLCYEYIIDPTDQPFLHFLTRMLVGIAVGLAGGFSIAEFIRRRWFPEESLNICTLASALALYTLSDILAHESGLLSVTIAGFVIGYLRKEQIEEVKVYKAELIQLLIGLLFVLLAANLDMSSFLDHGVKGVLLVAFIMLIVRPLNIFVSTRASNLEVREKLFLSWVAPRGIVAASMASLFTLNLYERGYPEAAFLETFTYSVIIGTVVFQGLTAKAVGRMLGVLEPKPKGWLIVGAHALGRAVALFLKKHGLHVVVIDMNHRSVRLAKKNGLKAIHANALNMSIDKQPDIYGIGNVLAITENEDLNTLLCQRLERQIPGVRTYRWGIRSNGDADDVNDRLMTGELIWNHFNLGRLTALDLEDHDIGVQSEETHVESITHPERVLMSFYGGGAQPYVPDGETGACSILAHRPFVTRFGFDLKPECIVFTEADAFSSVIREIVDRIHIFYPELDIENVYERLIEYSSKQSTIISPYIALPHTYITGISDSIVLVAKLKQPVTSNFGDEPVSLVIVVISQKGQPEAHLKTLSEISRLILSEKNRKCLLQAGSAEDLYNAFEDA